MTNAKLQRIWAGLDDNERFGLSFGLFPARLIPEKLTAQESVELIGMSQAKTGVQC